MVAKLKIILSLICILFITGCSMNHLPEGELIQTSYSPTEKYIVRIYLCSGNATTDFSIRGEVEDVTTQEKRNFYWEYHKEEATIEWINDETVNINGQELNVITDSYDWREE